MSKQQNAAHDPKLTAAVKKSEGLEMPPTLWHSNGNWRNQMPLFAYECRDCHEEFQTLVRSNEEPTCPSCGKQNLERLLSLIASPNKGGEDAGSCASGGPVCGGCSPMGCGMMN
jgi:putative FmdB family regulatory protein